MDPHVITLTELEWTLAKTVGHKRNSEDLSMNLGIGKFDAFGDGGFEAHEIGAAGELAFSKFLGIPYVPAGMKEIDVGGYEVKTSSKATYRLIVRKENADDKTYVHVVRVGPRTFRIVGWILGGDAKKVGSLENPEKGNSYGAAWFVPNDKLIPFPEAPQQKSAKTRETKKASWTEEEQALISWFLSEKNLPTQEFELFPGQTVTDTEKFFQAIAADIKDGYDGPRAHMGSLQADLRMVRAFVERSLRRQM